MQGLHADDERCKTFAKVKDGNLFKLSILINEKSKSEMMATDRCTADENVNVDRATSLSKERFICFNNSET